MVPDAVQVGRLTALVGDVVNEQLPSVTTPELNPLGLASALAQLAHRCHSVYDQSDVDLRGLAAYSPGLVLEDCCASSERNYPCFVYLSISYRHKVPHL